MSMKLQNWLSLPFLGGRSTDNGHEKQQHQPAGPGGRKTGQNANIALTKHESRANFANKGEEEIVQDYNAPIRWWVIATL